MNQKRRQSYHDMIEAAAKVQQAELSWVSNVYNKRLIELEKQRSNYEQWKRSGNHGS
jgi:hypothetical protein